MNAAFVSLTFLLASTCFAFSDPIQPKMFLAPNHGVRNVLADNDGMTLSQLCIDEGASYRIVEEEVCCFEPPSENAPPVVGPAGLGPVRTPTEPWSAKKRFRLFTKDSRLVMALEHGDVTLLDVSKDEWTNPAIGSPGMPTEGTCRVLSQRNAMFMGEKRLIVDVACTVAASGETLHAETWSLATGIGIIAVKGFTLVRVESIGGEETPY